VLILFVDDAQGCGPVGVELWTHLNSRWLWLVIFMYPSSCWFPVPYRYKCIHRNDT